MIRTVAAMKSEEPGEHVCYRRYADRLNLNLRLIVVGALDVAVTQRGVCIISRDNATRSTY
jgi:hypothetical protein